MRYTDSVTLDPPAWPVELAAPLAQDPEVARRAVGSLRRELDPPGASWPVALEMERGTQMWSLRRRSIQQG